MKQVLNLSLLLIVGLVGSQLLPIFLPDFYYSIEWVVKILTMVCLSYIMIHVGFEFTIDKSRLGEYGWDYAVAMTAAAFPWIFCALYFVYVLGDSSNPELWREGLLASRFAAPTSAGVLFSMLVAAGLGASWLFKKARILAIFDDLDTILLMIPLKMAFIGFQWELIAILVTMLGLLWIAWKHMHEIKIPDSWPWVLLYSVLITAFSESYDEISYFFGADVPLHFEVLLPAFVLGCVMKHPKAHSHDSDEVALGLFSPVEKRVAHIISACFMVFVGLSLPPLFGSEVVTHEVSHSVGPVYTSDTEFVAIGGLDHQVIQGKLSSADDMPWNEIAWHVLIVTLLANLGKMFPAFCYRKVASFRERIALAIGMWPRGEVGAGIIVIAVSLGIEGPMIVVAVLSLTLNLLLTGVFIAGIKWLLPENYGV